jgi:hypothetical protein
MHKFGVFTALTLSWVTASCAERVVNPVVIPRLASPKAAPKPRSTNVEARRRAEPLAESARRRLALHFGQVTPSASVKPEPSLERRTALPHGSEPLNEFPIRREPPTGATLPPPPEPAEPNFPVAALMPPPPEPAEPTLPTILPTAELPSPPRPSTSVPPEAPPEAAMPPPPNPAEPSFPVATLMPPPPEPAEPSLHPPSQEQVAAASPISIPFPDLPSHLSLRPRFNWVDTVGAIDLPHRPPSEALGANQEERVPSLIRTPWPLPLDGN